ncbi:hypothetical protein AVEN_5622-1 [Araneus ventricosus]|uniref:RNase H type-1 domain-containing protein n=1 Tax=Araneus ventricosus TaxID=182803 RepID=A0A4Y2P5Y7_ARAVE|nr:hypothetical protein AVEN_5622-1 [Araneus ventricosus]
MQGEGKRTFCGIVHWISFFSARVVVMCSKIEAKKTSFGNNFWVDLALKCPIFTDGSKCSSCTSFACVFINSTLSFQLHPSCSIFTAEITAILQALSQIFSGPPDDYIIYSDSLSALESMTSLNRFSHPFTFKILELHDRLTTKGFTIPFCWIPSHVGISGNELADNLARSATNSLNSPAPMNEVKKYVKSILHSKW